MRQYLLTYERNQYRGHRYSMAALAQLRRLPARITRNGRALAADPLFAARLARVEIELENMRITNLRVLAAVAGGGAPGPRARC